MSKQITKWDLKAQLFENLGNCCAKCCSEEKLELDHIFGNYELEKSFFAGNEQLMIEAYLRDFDQDSIFLQLLCSDCKKLKPIPLSKNQLLQDANDFVYLFYNCKRYEIPGIMILLDGRPEIMQTVYRHFRNYAANKFTIESEIMANDKYGVKNA